MVRTVVFSAMLLWMEIIGVGPVAAQIGRLVFTKQSPEATAEHLVNDRKFGGSSAKFAIEYGDQIIPLIKSESDNFKQLDNRNSFWIAEVLGKIDSELARQTLNELYARDARLARLVGSVGLHMQGIVPDRIDDNSYLVKQLRNHASDNITELAIIALGHSKSEDALPYLQELLVKPGYWPQRRACEAIARIKSAKSIPVLRQCLKDPDFSAIESAYRASICLGDNEATPLAIEWLSNGSERKYHEEKLIDELQTVTGKWGNGRKKVSWQSWWSKNEENWTIPKKFLVDWDKQPSPP